MNAGLIFMLSPLVILDTPKAIKAKPEIIPIKWLCMYDLYSVYRPMIITKIAPILDR